MIGTRMMTVSRIIQMEIELTETRLDSDLKYCSHNYLDFELADKQNPSTWVIDVWSKDKEDMLLGQIRWYAHWRQYALHTNPDGMTVFEQKCLTDITEMCRRLNVLQRAGIKPINPQKVLS